jgi:hypothetical protein
MKETRFSMDSSKPEDSLSRTLPDWRVTPARNPQFRAQVWQRIEAAGQGSPLPWGAYARTHARSVAGALAVAVVLGALGGREQARARVASESTRMASAYVQALDARSMRMP